MKPLEGCRIIELAGIGPGPYCGQLLADLGAEVVTITRPGQQLSTVDARGKKSLVLDLRKPGAAEVVLKLVEGADALLEGNRPGVAERLGVGPDACLQVNPRLVYGRMTGWGQTGPWATMAGHDINYISITGALLAMGRKGDAPTVPLNLVGDYGGGSLFLAMGILAALLKAQKTGKGDVVDAAIVDGVSSMAGVLHTLTAHNQWTVEREANLLDGGAPYYRCFRTKDGKFMAAGPLEPQFFSKMLEVLGIDAASFGEQNDREKWPAQHRHLEQVFASRTREEWSALFDCVDACVTPVLDYMEAVSHPHNVARNSHVLRDGLTHPHQAPRFGSDDRDWSPGECPELGADAQELLRAADYSDEEIAALYDAAIIARASRKK